MRVTYILKNSSFIFLCFLIFSCTTNRLLELENDINSYIDEHKSEPQITLRLDTISSFEWDELLIVGSYTDLEMVDGYQLNKFPNEIKHHDSFTFVGFLNKKKGVKWIELNEAKIFDKIIAGGNKGFKIYRKSDCIFELKE
jgi:hypothetical protein